MRTQDAALALALAAGTVLSTAHAASALSPPVQVSPADGETITGWRNITFVWDFAAGSPKYGIQIQALAGGSWVNVKVVHGIDHSSRYTQANFTSSDDGRWRVRSEGSSGNSAWSGWRHFSIDPGISTAAQKPKVVEVSKPLSLPASGSVTDVAVCPAGSIVVGGGWASGTPGDVLVSSSGWDLDSWYGYFINSTASALVVTVYAECLENASGYAYAISQISDVPLGKTITQQLTCDQGVVSGGGFAVATSVLFAVAAISSTSLEIMAYNNGAVVNDSILGEAVCLVGSGAKVNIATGTAHNLPASGSASAGVACAAGKVALGGGFAAIHEGAMASVSARSIGGNGWRATMEDFLGTPNSLTVDAICAKIK